MSLFLPHSCWMVTLSEELTNQEEWEYSTSIGQLLQQHNWNLFEGGNKAVLDGKFDPAQVAGQPEVQSVEAVWVYTTNDAFDFPEHPTGQTANCCGGSSVIYKDRDQAIRDLATVFPELKGLLELAQTGPEPVRGLARVVLDGKMETLPILADALEEGGHPLAAMVRYLGKEHAEAQNPGQVKKPAAKKGADPSGFREQSRWTPSEGEPYPIPDCVLAVQEGAVIRGVSWTASGKRLAWLSLQTELRLRNAATGEVLGTWSSGPPLCAGAVSPDGKLIAACVGFAGVGVAGYVSLFNTSSNNPKLSRDPQQESVYHVVFSPDSTLFATAYHKGTIDVWDSTRSTPLQRLYGHDGRVWSLAFAGDGKLLASGGEDGTVRLWDPVRAYQVRLLQHQAGSHVASVAFSPDGKLLASGGFDGTIGLWETATGKEVRRLKAPKTCSLSFLPASPKGKAARLVLASGDGKGSIHLWDVNAGRKLRTLMGHAGAVYCVAFAPNGQRLATGGADGMGRIWDLSSL